jgi:hypothetical protein
LDAFFNLPIRKLVCRFCVTDFPLWKLSCLLCEEWLHEDVLNALAELLYFSQAAVSTSEIPTTLILPTHFLSDAKFLLHQSPPFFSPNLAALRHQLEKTSVDKIFAFNVHSNHYSTYRASESASLGYGDSMHLLPDVHVPSIWHWFLSGTGFTVPSSVETLDVASQGTGSGSCGIAALNLVETDLDAETDKWSPSTSPFFRNRALRDLTVYHASRHGTDEVSPLLFMYNFELRRNN